MVHNSDRHRDFWSAALLALTLLAAGYRLYLTHWTFGLGIVLLLILIGATIGLSLGSSKFKGPVVFLLGLGYSLVLPSMILAGFLYSGLTWLERLANLSAQLATSLAQLTTHQPVHDPILFIAFVAVLFWIISLSAGYALTRSENFVGAVLPSGVALVIIQIFDMRSGDHVYSLAIYVFLCLLLLGRLAYVRRHRSWQERNIWLPVGSTADLNIVLGATALALVVLAWAIPASSRPVSSARIAWENLTRTWPLRRDLDRAVASLRGNQPQLADFYGSTLALGQQARVGDEVYLRIQVPPAFSELRYYWRVRAYDWYEDGKWRADNAFEILISPEEDTLSLPDARGPTGRFTFTALDEDFSALVTPPHPIWVSRPTKLIFFPAADEKRDPILFQATPSILVGEQYTVRANIYEPTIADLREAGENYPTWVSDQFLQLPADLPVEIPLLAQRVAAGAETPYEQAAAVTAYLRANFTYSTNVDPPADQDPLLWFLFDAKTGFCNYYATAEVILLRSLGIPARLAVGFAAGEYEAPDQYTVLQRDAHAWPEVYFPEIGWVEFEPTSSQPPLVRPEGDEPADAAGNPLSPVEDALGENNQQPTVFPQTGATGVENPLDPTQALTIALSVISLLLIAGFLVYIFGGLDKPLWTLQRIIHTPMSVALKRAFEKLSLTPPRWLANWAHSAELTPTIRSFTIVYRSLRWLGEDVPPTQTPAEAAARLTERLPEASDEIHILLHECQRSLYARRPGDLPIAVRAAKAVRRAVFRQRWATFKTSFQLKK